MKSKSLLLGMLFTLLTTNVFAAKITLVTAKDNVTNLDKVLIEAKHAVNATAFPDKVPASTDVKLYASLVKNDPTIGINIDSTADCNDVKNCNIGKLTFQQRENVTLYYDNNNKLATSPVALADGIQGYYTRGFAMGDFWPANIQWRDGEILYTLTWGIEDKATFIKMANSVIQQIHH